MPVGSGDDCVAIFQARQPIVPLSRSHARPYTAYLSNRPEVRPEAKPSSKAQARFSASEGSSCSLGSFLRAVMSPKTLKIVDIYSSPPLLGATLCP